MRGSRPDIAAAVGFVCRYAQNPGKTHWTAVKRIFRYLKGTIELGITYDGNADDAVTFTGYCDSDWAENRDNSHSTTGYIFYMAGGPIVWKSVKQRIVATSTCEAEYMAAFEATKEAIWIHGLLAAIYSHRHT